MKQVGNVEIPQEAFLAVLRSGWPTDEFEFSIDLSDRSGCNYFLALLDALFFAPRLQPLHSTKKMQCLILKCASA